jgi:hypothetical protein
VSEFTITEVPGALSYLWTLSPATAGTMEGNGLAGTVTWDKSYRGNATIRVQGVNDCGEGIQSEDKIVKLYAPVGISEYDGIALGISPNPSNGKFSLDISTGMASKVSLTVYNTLGTAVYAENDLRFHGKLHKNLDLSHLAKGVYRLKVEGNGYSGTVSVVIVK